MLLGMTAVIGVVVALLLANLDDSVDAGTAAQNVTDDANDGIQQFFDQYGLIGLMIGLGIVLLVVVGVFFAVRRGGGF